MISARRKLSRIAVLALATAAIATVALAGDSWKKISNPGDRLYNETFELGSGDLLKVDVQDTDVEIKLGGNGQAQVEVWVLGKNRERAQELYDELRFRVRKTNGTLAVETNVPRSRSWKFWDTYRGINVRTVITIPKGTDMKVVTDDGDIRAESLQGEIDLRTSDGDVVVSEIDGKNVNIKTSDGDIRASRITGTDIELRTSDGDVEAEEVEGKTVIFTSSDGDVTIDRATADDLTMSTSDGDVVVDRATADHISLSSSDGDIRIGADGGKLTARTSDGNVRVIMLGEMALNLKTHDGDIYIEMPSKLKADLNLRGEHVSVHGNLDIQGEISKRRIVGSLKGGGVEIVASTGDGTISLAVR